MGLVVGAGLTGGLWDLFTGSALITLVPPDIWKPPPSNTPGSSSRVVIGSCGGSSLIDLPPGVESGLGGFGPTSVILGEDGLMRSGEEVLVSATDSPRSGQRHCLKANCADGCLL